ncbi:DUF2480 family protein [Rhodocaloribacter litoris]|uniref:DUF2480 family protein n=1 Tax=Rhodocaloribacter litoris TaxID=2558931 RepID=UPI001422AC90|nr:DUF2480 family protein [Rhodocaloribacter litoris]QXD14072.1 DUF2480 family protein [Rhodocaloribacter litoris]
MEPIVNRVAESDIDVYNLEALWDGGEVVELDLAPFLVQGLVLREKVFRAHVAEHDWARYADRHVAVHCSADAIVPVWAYMLIATKLHGVARSVAFGRAADLIRDHFTRALEAEDWSRYEDRIVVVKGCGSKVVPVSAYLVAVQKLQAVARKLMYGEPCSSVPLWRRPAGAETPARPRATARPVIPPPGVPDRREET